MTALPDAARVRRTPTPAPSAWTPPSRSAARIGYGVPVLAAILATLTWFSPGRFIASGDISPFIRDNLAGELTDLWNHQITGAGSASYSITQLVEVLILGATRLIGLPDPVAQLLLYAAVTAAAAFGTAYLAAVWTDRPWPIAAAGLVGVFNAYVLVNIPNLLPLLAIALIGVLVGLVLRAAAGVPVAAVRFAVLTLPVSYLAQNPPLVAVVALCVVGAWVGATALTAPGGSARAGRLLLRAAPLVLLVNLFWLVPYVITLVTGSGLTFTAQTDVGAWAWTQVRSGLGNVVSLNTHWGWDDPNYFPYAAAMDGGLAGAQRWVLPALAWAGLLVAGRGSRRRRLWTLAVVGLMLVWLAKGLHPPLGAVNGWLYAHVPGMWLLRDPMSKLGAVLVLLYAIGVSQLVYAAAGRLRAVESRQWRRAGRVLLVAATVGAVAYPWPLYTGAVVPGARGYLPADRVSVPDDWRSITDFVNERGGPGKVVVLPLDPYYQVTTDWGYHGVDAVPAQLLTAPVLRTLPGGYFTETAGAEALLAGVQTALLTGDTAGVPGRLRALGASTVIVRHDLVATPDLPAPADSRQIAAALARTPGVGLAAYNAVADVYRVDQSAPVQLAADLIGVRADSPDGVSAAVAALPPDTAVTTSSQVPVTGFSWQVDQTGTQAFTLAHAGRYALRASAIAQASYQARADPAGGVLTLTDADAVTVDGQPLPGRPGIDIPVTSTDITAIAVGDRLSALPASGAAVTLPASATVTAYAPAGPAVRLTDRFGPLGDCNNVDGRSPNRAGLGLDRPDGDTLELTAAAHSACTAASIPVPGAGELVQIDFSYRTQAGRSARFCLWQVGPNSCATQAEPLSDSDGLWRQYSGPLRISPGTAGLQLYLYADGQQDPPTTVQYRDIQARALRSAGSATATPSSAPAQQRNLTAGAHAVSFTSAVAAPGPTGYSPLANCHNTRGITNDQAGLSVHRDADGTVALHALSDTACITAEPTIVNPGSVYRLQLSYRTASGRPARVCLWEMGPDRCADIPDLVADPDWHTQSTTVRIDAGTRQLQLYLYADGQANPPTSVAYRDVSLTRSAPVSIVVTPAGPSVGSDRPTLQVGRITATATDLTVHGLSGSVALVLTESFAPGWHVEGLPDGWTAEHFDAYGYANGWLLHGTGDAHLTLRFGPQQWATLAQWVSLLTVLTALLAWSLRRYSVTSVPLARVLGRARRRMSGRSGRIEYLTERRVGSPSRRRDGGPAERHGRHRISAPAAEPPARERLTLESAPPEPMAPTSPSTEPPR